MYVSDDFLSSFILHDWLQSNERPDSANTTVDQSIKNATFNQGKSNVTFNQSESKATFNQGKTNATFDENKINATFDHSKCNATFDQMKINATFDHCKSNATFDQGKRNIAFVGKSTSRTSNEMRANAIVEGYGNITFDCGKNNVTYDEGKILPKPMPTNGPNHQVNTTFEAMSVGAQNGTFCQANSKVNHVNTMLSAFQTVNSVDHNDTMVMSPIPSPATSPNLNKTRQMFDSDDHQSQKLVRVLNRSYSMPCYGNQNNNSSSSAENLNAQVHELCQNQSYSCINLMDAEQSVLKHILKMEPEEHDQLRRLSGTPVKNKVSRVTSILVCF